MSPRHSEQMSQRAPKDRIIKSLGLLFGGVLNVIVIVFAIAFFIVFFVFHCIFVGQVMSLHHCDQMSQRPQVSRIALQSCSQNVLVFVFVIVLFWSGYLFSSL